MTDVTEFTLFGHKLYLPPILDLCSRDIVSYSISDKSVLSMVTGMLDKAFARIPDGTKLILHPDQGLAVPAQTVPANAESEGYPAEYEPQGQLPGQRLN